MLELLLAEVTPSPTPITVPDEALITPGAWGFVITFAVGLAAIALFYDMVRRMRRVRYREQIDEMLEAEAAAAHAAAEPDILDALRRGDDPEEPAQR